MTAGEAQLLEDFYALIAMLFTGVYDDLSIMDVWDRVEAREAQRRVA